VGAAAAARWLFRGWAEALTLSAEDRKGGAG